MVNSFIIFCNRSGKSNDTLTPKKMTRHEMIALRLSLLKGVFEARYVVNTTLTYCVFRGHNAVRCHQLLGLIIIDVHVRQSLLLAQSTGRTHMVYLVKNTAIGRSYLAKVAGV